MLTAYWLAFNSMKLSELRIEKLCVATPYIEEINGLEKSFLEQNKIDVLNIKGLGIA